MLMHSIGSKPAPRESSCRPDAMTSPERGSAISLQVTIVPVDRGSGIRLQVSMPGLTSLTRPR